MKINKGDIFRVGKHVIGFGDSLDKEFVAKVVGTAKIKIILCDPPYGVAYVENKKNFASLSSDTNKVIANDHIQTESEYETFTSAYLDAIVPHLEAYNACYIFNGDPMFPSLRSGMIKSGFYYSQMLIWLKNQPVMSRKDYLSSYELIAYGWFGKHKMQRTKGKNVMYYPRPQKSNLHPTQKPIGLLRKIIPDNTNVGDVVYDPFLGSGSTALACEHLSRKCIGIEIDKEYVGIIIQRLEKLTGVKAIKI